MKVTFYLKGSCYVEWQVPERVPPFNFQLMVKLLRADGQFLDEGIYVVASEVQAVLLHHQTPEEEEAAETSPNVRVVHRNKVTRLVS